MEQADISKATEVLRRKPRRKITHEINGNATSNGLPASNELPTVNGLSASRPELKKRPKVAILSQIRYVIECLICNAVVLVIAPYILPLVLFYFFLKKLEQLVEFRRHKAISLTGEDAIWQQDSDKNRLIVNGVVFVDRPGDFETALKEYSDVIRTKLVESRDSQGELSFPRARQFIRPGYFQYFFQDDPNFDIKDHVFQYDGEFPKTKEELEDIISRMSSKPFPEGKSPWYYCCVPTDFGKKQIAAIFRMHHSMADGVSMSRFLTRIFPDQFIPQKEAIRFSSYERGLLTVKAYFIAARVVVGLILSFADRSIVHGKELCGKKKVAWSETFDLNLVKRIKNATGTTVNDVLMSCTSLAIRRYFLKKGIDRPADFTASIPVDMSPPSEEVKFQNKFACVFLKLPASKDGIVDILHETKRRMDILKISGEPLAMAKAMSLSVAFIPEFLCKPLMSFISSKASCVLSNVPGPQYLMSAKGNAVNFMIFWPPQRNSIGIGLSLYSYAGKVIIGIQGDIEIMPDPEAVTELFGTTLQEMASCVLGSTEDRL